MTARKPPPELEHPGELLPWWVNGTLGGEELRRVEDHLRSCLVCRREVDELRELRREVKTFADAAPPATGGLDSLLEEIESEPPGARWGARRRRLPPWLPMLAAAALAVAVGVVFWPQARPPPPVERAGEEAAVLWSPIAEDEALPRDAFLLRWQTAPEWRGARFSLSVTEADLKPVAVADGLGVMHYQVPAEVLAELPSGARLHWRIEAVRPDGARSTQRFRVRVE